MLLVLNQEISKNNLKNLKELLSDKEIITDPEHLEFFLTNFPEKQINVLSKKVLHKDHINIFFDIDYLALETIASSRKYVVCGEKSLKFKFKCYPTKEC